MSQEQKNSLLDPVGKVLCQAQTAGGGMIGIAQVNLSLAPVGCELYVQPSEGRLKLEVEVANDNAMHWKHTLMTCQAQKKRLREALRKIASIQDNLNGGDWDEIEEARQIANEALKE